MDIQLGILFWFYKDINVCENRLQILSKFNPETPIFGLYGGSREEEEHFRTKLEPYLNSFYRIPEDNSFQKWINGDLYILDWYNNIGKKLQWESIVIVQWDLLALISFSKLFSTLKKNEIFLHPLKKIDKKFEKEWYWTSKKSLKQINLNDPKRPFLRTNYLKFKKLVKEKYSYDQKIPRTIFMLAVFSRNFLETYRNIEDIHVGFLEYKIPTYAKIFEVPIHSFSLGENIKLAIEDRPLNARSHEISRLFIDNELKKKDGWRVFHPYYKKFETDPINLND